MARKLAWITLLFVFTVAGLPESGGGTAADPQRPAAVGKPNPVPMIEAITPSSANAGGADFLVTVSGQKFVTGSVVRWNNSDRLTTFISSTQLRASIPASDIAICAGGIAQLIVFNPLPGGGTSNALTFTIANPAPNPAALSPSQVSAGGPGFTLRVSGTGFTCGSVVRWNGSDRPTTFVDSTSLLVSVPSSDVQNAGTAQVTVFTPAPGGGGSTITLAIVNPIPQLTAVSPSTAPAGSGLLQLTVSGQFFVPSSTVRWNSSDRATTYLNNTQLQAQISANDLFAPGTASITVVNPQPGGGGSQAVSFTIGPATNHPSPVIASLSDTQAPAGWPGFSLVVRGSGFAVDSALRWDGLNRATTVVDSTRLRAAIAPSDLTSPGTGQVTVFNPSPGGGASNAVTFTITPVASGAVGVIEQSSVNAQFEPGNAGSSQAVLSANGRYVAFSSDADNLVPNDTNRVSDVFLRDTCRGPNAPPGCTPSITRISVTDDGSEAVVENMPASEFDFDAYYSQGLVVIFDCNPSGSYDANIVFVCLSYGSFVHSISADGRFVVFSSDAINLVANENNHAQDVFVRDTCVGAAPGCTPSTFRASVAGDGTEASGESSEGAVSADGRFIAFRSYANNLVPDDSNSASDVFVRDMCIGIPAGCVPSTFRASLGNDGAEGNDYSGGVSLSADGRFVAFDSHASNLMPNDTNRVTDLFVRDTCFGTSTGCVPSTSVISVPEGGGQANDKSESPAISLGGRFVVFPSVASNLVVGDTNGQSDVFLRDTCMGGPAGCQTATLRVSLADGDAEPNGASFSPKVSDDGRFVAFTSTASNLVAGDTNNAADAFVRDTCIGAQSVCVPRTWRVSVALDGTQGNAGSWTDGLSADGRHISFVSGSGNLAPGDSNQKQDVFLARVGHP